MTRLHPVAGPSKGLIIAAFAALYLIWGSTYLGIAYALKSIPPFLMVAVRFLLAGGLLYGWCLLRGEKTPPLRSVGISALAGLLMLFIGNGAVVWVEQYLPSGLAAIIVATVPLWFVALDRRQWAAYFANKWIVAGLLVGFGGVVYLFSGNSSAQFFDDPQKLASLFVLVLGTIGWTVGSLYSKYKPAEGSTPMKVAIQMLAAGIAGVPVSVATGETAQFSWSALTPESAGALLYLVVFGSLVAYSAYVWLLSVRPPSLVGTYAYVNPVVAVFLGWLFAGEAIGSRQVVALAIILAGVILVNIAKEKKPEAEAKLKAAA
ncbi:MAG TPA: EamA family transporter [Chitinophagaceae bacterium]|jgi:drug/metabolite transporter (DMT)-like permease|nr:EamA family transporter [Chitinophagaceae bacterium]